MMVLKVLKKVFQKWEYVTIAALISSSVFVLAVWLPNIGLVVERLSGEGTIEERTKLPIVLLGSITTNFSLFSAFTTILIAILLGISIALIVFSFRQKNSQSKMKGTTTSFLGTLSGLLGIGCAACGSVILTPLLVVLGGTAFLAWLPLGGAEFGILAIGLLLFSIFVTAKEIEHPAPCKIR